MERIKDTKGGKNLSARNFKYCRMLCNSPNVFLQNSLWLYCVGFGVCFVCFFPFLSGPLSMTKKRFISLDNRK